MRLRGAFLLLAALAAGVEAALRWGVGLGDPVIARIDPETEYELAGPADYRRWGRTINVNSFGMRAPEFRREAAPGEFRVMLIGDSVIYGNHFLDQSETISARLAEDLREGPAAPDCVPVVMPVAAASWGPANQAAFIRREGVFGADAAAIVLSAHDLHDTPTKNGRHPPYRTKPSSTAIGDALMIARERFGLRSPAAPNPTQRPSLEERAATSLAALDEMASELAAAGAWTILVYHPTTMERAGAEDAARAVFFAWAAGRGIPFIDLGEATPEPGGYRDEIHPDAVGAARIARVLAEALTLPPAPPPTCAG